MKSKIAQSIIAGLTATAAMTGFMFLTPLIGFPKMNPAEILSNMMGLALTIGYLIHMIIGIIFAAVYIYLFNPKIHIYSKLAKGFVFGFTVFIFAQIMMFIVSKFMPMTNDNMMLIMADSLMGHLVYGITISLINPAYTETSEKYTQASHAY